MGMLGSPSQFKQARMGRGGGMTELSDQMQAEFLERNERPTDGAEEWFQQADEHNRYEERMAEWREKNDAGELGPEGWKDMPRYRAAPSVLEPGTALDDGSIHGGIAVPMKGG